MTVLILGNSDSIHVQRWLRELAARKMNPICVGFGAKVTPYAKHYRVPGSFPYALPVAVLMCWFLIWRRKVNLVHCHYLTSYGLIGALCLFRPMIVSAWGSDILITARRSWLTRFLVRFILARSWCVFADSLELGEAVRELAPANVENVQWGIDLNRFPHVRNFSSRRARTFVSLRAHEPLYNIETIVRAFHEAELPDDASLHIAGQGTITQNLRCLSISLGIASQVHFHGQLTEAQVGELLKRSDVSLSVPRSDGTSVSVLESMACGLPLICSDLASNRQWLERGGALFVRECRDLGEFFKDLYRGRYDLAAMGERNRRMILQKANQEAHMRRVEEIYRSAISHSKLIGYEREMSAPL